MILYGVDTHPQGSAKWVKARLGIPTASEFEKILTPSGKPSGQARDYCFRLIAEIIMKQPMESMEGLGWIERGQTLEPQAVQFYEFENAMKTEEIGFIIMDDGQAGCSPDRFVGDEGLLEIKCPAPQTHIGYMIDGLEPKYKPQLQGQLYISGRKWVDWFSFHPSMPPVCIRVERDEKYIELLEAALTDFIILKNELLLKIRENGFFAERDRVLMIGEEEANSKKQEWPDDIVFAG